jgi:hypothetical protein
LKKAPAVYRIGVVPLKIKAFMVFKPINYHFHEEGLLDHEFQLINAF